MLVNLTILANMAHNLQVAIEAYDPGEWAYDQAEAAFNNCYRIAVEHYGFDRVEEVPEVAAVFALYA